MPPTQRAKNLVGDLVCERVREQRIEHTRRMLLAAMQLATVRSLGNGFARGMTTNDIFGLDVLLHDRGHCS